MITSIGIIPSSTGASIEIYLVGEDNSIEIYSLSKNILATERNELNEILDSLESKAYPDYISTFKDDIKWFKPNVLIPLPSNELSFYSNLSFEKAFIEGKIIDQVGLVAYINNFFSNPELIWMKENSHMILYGDDKVLVKFSEEGILEYTSMDLGKTSQSNEASAFVIAEEF